MLEFGIKWPLGLGREDLVGAGITALVRFDAIYQRLGHDHSGIIKYFGVPEDGIILQFAGQTSIR